MSNYHDCGGTILTGSDHDYCDTCRAYVYRGCSEPFPSGTDTAANRAAWDRGDDRSPDADPTYSIDDANGDQITTGLAEVEAMRIAQEAADDRGEPVYVYDTMSGEDGDMVEVTPSEVV